MRKLKEPLEQTLKVAKTVESRPYQVFLRFDDWGWASMTIDDSFGLVNVQSDWLNGGYCWPRRNLPGKQSTSEFIASFAGKGRWGCDYLANKLFNGQRDEFDLEDTVASFKEDIIRWRRSGHWDKYDAQEAWEALDEISEHNIPDKLQEIDDFYENIQKSPSMAFQMMRDCVLPLLAQAVKDHLDRDATG